MGRYSCPRADCVISADAVTSIQVADAYIGVSRHNKAPSFPKGLLNSNGMSAKRVLLNLENARTADVQSLCMNADITVGYRNFCSELVRDTKPTFIATSYVSDPEEAFRLPPADRGSKEIFAFSMVKNCGVGVIVFCSFYYQ